MTQGLLSHIQRFSVHDGPGIRTTVFLKGCQMQCVWCHNPETRRAHPELQVFVERCIGCGACVERCEHGARRMNASGIAFDRAECVACGRCAEVCHAKSLVMVGRKVTADQVVEEVTADRAFYKKSGGGVTVSGGEPLCQPEFTSELLRLAKDRGFHAAVETNLAWPWSRVASVLSAVDLFMVDVKTFDDALHRRWTGVSNRQTLDNLRRLDEQHKPLIARTPVIAGVNDSVEEISQIVTFLATLSNVVYYELLPYHPFGLGKYAALGIDTPPTRFERPSAGHIEQLADLARNAGLEVRIAGSANEDT